MYLSCLKFFRFLALVFVALAMEWRVLGQGGGGGAGAEVWGEMRSWFVPHRAGPMAGRYRSVTVDARGRVIVAHGTVSVYDGFDFAELPSPGGIQSYVTDVDADAQGRIWTSTGRRTGFYEEQPSGGWRWVEVHEQEGSPGESGGALAYGVHCVDDAVVVVKHDRIMRFRPPDRVPVEWRLASSRGLYGAREGNDVFVVRADGNLGGGVDGRAWRVSARGEPALVGGRLAPWHGVGVFGTDGRLHVAKPVRVSESGERAWDILPSSLPPVGSEGLWIFGGVSWRAAVSLSGAVMHAYGDLPLRPASGAGGGGGVSEPVRQHAAAGPDGRIWSVNARGLLAIEPDRTVSVFQGHLFPGNINAIRRVGGHVYFGTNGGLFALPVQGGGGEGGVAEGVKRVGQDVVAVMDVQPGGLGVLVAGDDIATFDPQQPQRTWRPGVNTHGARALAELPGGNGVILEAGWHGVTLWRLQEEAEVRLRSMRVGGAGGVSVAEEAGSRMVRLWQRKMDNLDRALPLENRRALVFDRGGNGWLFTWKDVSVGNASVAWTLDGEPEPVPPVEGIGRIRNLEQTWPGCAVSGVWAFTERGVWWLDKKGKVFRRATVRARDGVAPRAVGRMAGDGGRMWVLADAAGQTGRDRDAGAGGGLGAGPWMGVFEGRILSGGGLALGEKGPVAVVDNVGMPSCTWFEEREKNEAVWWVGGTDGAARVLIRGGGGDV